jgi:hypothetical protein
LWECVPRLESLGYFHSSADADEIDVDASVAATMTAVAANVRARASGSYCRFPVANGRAFATTGDAANDRCSSMSAALSKRTRQAPAQGEQQQKHRTKLLHLSFILPLRVSQGNNGRQSTRCFRVDRGCLDKRFILKHPLMRTNKRSRLCRPMCGKALPFLGGFILFGLCPDFAG